MSSGTMTHFSPFGNSTWKLLSFLSIGLDGHGSWSITASKNGLTLKCGSIVVARGKTVDELCRAYDAFAAKTKADLARAKREVNRQETSEA